MSTDPTPTPAEPWTEDDARYINGLPPAETPDPTPAAAYEPYAAGVLTEMGVEPYISGGKWRFEVDEVQMMALISRVYLDGRANGRAAQGCCQAAVDSEGNAHDSDCRYLAGLAAGRTAAAAQVRAIAADIRTSEGQPGEWVPSTTGMLAVLIDGVAARVAENGADHARD